MDSIMLSREETTDDVLGSPLLDITWNFDPPERDRVAAAGKRGTMTVEAGPRRLPGSVS